MAYKKVNHDSTHHAAVIVLYERRTESIILTKRSEHLRFHPGEICFPGGAWEEGDKDLYATALREMQEEIGISPERVTFIRPLDIQQTLLGSIIHPWFGSIETIIPYQLNPNEVTRLVTVPLSRVRSLDNYQEVMVERGRFRFKSWEFNYAQEWIWGATAKIMRQLALGKLDNLPNAHP